MGKLIDYLLDLPYPTRCVICREPMPPGRPGLCGACQARWLRPERSKTQYVSVCVSAMSYEDEAADAVRRFKFDGCQAYARAFSEPVAERIYEELHGRYDVLSWVPLAADRRRERGYDQTELIARHAARRLCQPLTPTLKKKNGIPRQSQSGDAASRRANVLGAYSVPRPETVDGLRILLIDDILTSGATLSECAKMLRAAGAAEVLCASLARTPEHSEGSGREEETNAVL